MKDTGIVRNVDDLGRFVLPMELRKKLNINIGDPLEVFVQNDIIMLRKYSPSDIFNGESEDLVEYCGKKVSKKSIVELAKLAGYELSEK